MSPDVKPLGLSALENGVMSPLLQEVWSWHREAAGFICPKLDLATVCLTKTHMQVERLPEFVSIGAETLISRTMGDQWSEEAHGTNKPTDPVLDRLVRPGFERAASGKTSLEIVSISADTPTGFVELHYERLLLPVQTRVGLPFLLIVTHPLSVN